MSTIQHRSLRDGTTRYRVVWRDSEQKQRSRAFTDRDFAERWKALLDVVGTDRALSALDDAPPAEGRTVAQQVSDHIDSLSGVTIGTRRVYRSHLARIIEPSRIGSMELTMLTKADAAAWVNDLEEAGVASKTVANYFGLLSSALATAVEQGRLTGNPVRGIRLPKGAKRKMTTLDHAEFATLLAAVPERWQPLVLTLVGTGMRFGEATAVTVQDVDLEALSISVDKAWKYTAKGDRQLGTPKTDRSTRTVAFPSQMVPALRPLVAGRGPAELLFTAVKGGRVTQREFWGRVWVPAVAVLAGDEIKQTHRGATVVKQGKGKRPRVHDLRHTHASWAIKAGVPLPVIQRQLGHESITTTVDTYGHLARSDFDALGAAIGARLPVLPPTIEPPA